jgi:hypothetical protein
LEEGRAPSLQRKAASRLDHYRTLDSVTDTGKPGGEDVDGDIEPMVVAGGDQEEDNDLFISSQLSC